MNSLIIIALATWRVTSLFKDEDGPYHIFEKIRNYFGIKKFEDFNDTFKVGFINLHGYEPEVIHDDSLMSEVLSCHWCLSIWVGLFFSTVAAVLSVISWQQLIFIWFASSALSILYEKIMEKLS